MPLVVVQSPGNVQLFAAPWNPAHQASLSLTISQFVQVHVHCIGDAIQPSHPLSSSSPSSLSLYQMPLRHRNFDFGWIQEQKNNAFNVIYHNRNHIWTKSQTRTKKTWVIGEAPSPQGFGQITFILQGLMVSISTLF